MHQKQAENDLAYVGSSANEVVLQQQLCTLGSCLYGLPDINVLPHHDSSAKTVEQEFEAYTMANLSLKATDILTFWEVNILHLHMSYPLSLTMRC